MPKVTLIEPEGTYLLWLDSGHIFGKAGRGFQRLNIACPWSTLQNGLEHLVKAFENR